MGWQSETNYKRVYVAEVLEDYIDSNIPQNEYTIIMGDLTIIHLMKVYRN